MIESYDILFSVGFRHNYYRDGRCNEISVTPDKYTQELIRKHGFIYQDTKAGFSVLAKSNKSNNDIIISEKVETNLQLNFLLSFSNPYLPNITDLAYLENKQIHFYSNTLIDADTGNGDLLYFPIGNSIQASGGLLLSGSIPEGINQLEKGGETFTLEADSETDPATYKTNGLDPGVYKVSFKGSEKYFLLNSQETVQNPFALLSIQVNDKSTMDNKGKMFQPQFALQLQTRKTYWQYILFQKEKKQKLVVEASGMTDMFEQTEKVDSIEKPVIIFTSKQEIPITEVMDNYFRLKLRNGDPANDLILISKLPVPDMKVLNRYTDGKIYTPIYINF